MRGPLGLPGPAFTTALPAVLLALAFLPAAGLPGAAFAQSVPA